MNDYCLYYQAQVPRDKTWFLVGILRSYEHLVFDRTIDKEKGIFEFFVPEDLETHFLELMALLENRRTIQNLQKLKNRLS